jgi:hypothetical protein
MNVCVVFFIHLLKCIVWAYPPIGEGLYVKESKGIVNREIFIQQNYFMTMIATIKYVGFTSHNNATAYELRKAISAAKKTAQCRSFLCGIGGMWEEQKNPSDWMLSTETTFHNLPVLEVKPEQVKTAWVDGVGEFYLVNLSDNTFLIGFNGIKGGGLNQNQFPILYSGIGGNQNQIFPSALLDVNKD